MGKGHMLAMVQRQYNGAIEANLGSLFAGVAAYHICHMASDGRVGVLKVQVLKVARPLEEFHCPGCFDRGALKFADCLPFCHGKLDHLALDVFNMTEDIYLGSA